MTTNVYMPHPDYPDLCRYDDAYQSLRAGVRELLKHYDPDCTHCTKWKVDTYILNYLSAALTRLDPHTVGAGTLK